MLTQSGAPVALEPAPPPQLGTRVALFRAKGVYEELPGWTEDITECRSESDLPQAAREYLDYISDFIGVPVALIGVGPGREQVIWTGTPSVAAPVAAS